MDVATPWYMLFELYGLCTLNDIYNLKYDWFWKETDNYPEFNEYNTIYHYNYGDSPNSWTNKCNGYYGSTTDRKVLIESKNHHDYVGQKWVVDKVAYDEKVIDHYECSCGATK